MISRDWATPIIWFGPALVLLFAVTLYPTAVVVWLSLSRTRYYDVLGWAGVGNYVSVLTSAAFWDLTLNSLIYMIGSLAIVLPVGLFAATGIANDEARRLVLSRASAAALDAVHGCRRLLLAMAAQPVVRTH